MLFALYCKRAWVRYVTKQCNYCVFCGLFDGAFTTVGVERGITNHALEVCGGGIDDLNVVRLGREGVLVVVCYSVVADIPNDIGNEVFGDFNAEFDQGAFGAGGLYGFKIFLLECLSVLCLIGAHGMETFYWFDVLCLFAL